MNRIVIRNLQPVDNALQQLDIHPILRRVYANRGIQSPEQLETELNRLLSYHDLQGIAVAVDYLYTALQLQQRILIVGDYDVDGATSTALMMRVLRKFGAKNVDFFIPDRFTYGYGLTTKIIELAAKRDPHLIITVDNGITSITGIEAANALGIKVIVTDHHLAGAELPPAAAIINPNQPEDKFASKNLAGVGVAFYVLLALRAKLRQENWFILQNITEPNLANYLDLVALGTVADVVSLDKNNRILVYQGLRRIQQGNCCIGITELLRQANCNQACLTAKDLGYIISPRLNAAGRLQDMSVGVTCLLTDNRFQAQQIASQLNKLNTERRNIEKKMQHEAWQVLANYETNMNVDLPIGLCLFNENWHQGVVGILASRIRDRFHRPVIAFAKSEEGMLKGSARSIPGLHIREVLSELFNQHPELITKFGGHAQAAGVVIAATNFTQFSQLFAQAASNCLTAADLQGKLTSDGELAIDDFSIELAELLRDASPWGQGFAEPLFDNKFRLLQQRIVGGNHLKLMLGIENYTIPAIAFNIDTKSWPNQDCEYVHAAYCLDINEYLGQRSLQLVVKYLQPVMLER
jgi:single-stranded-DNA-specific exonuclease